MADQIKKVLTISNPKYHEEFATASVMTDYIGCCKLSKVGTGLVFGPNISIHILSIRKNKFTFISNY